MKLYVKTNLGTLCIILIFLIISGCSSHPKIKIEQYSEPHFGKPDNDKALVYFIRLSSFVGAAQKQHVYQDGEWVSVFWNNSYTYRYFDPTENTFFGYKFINDYSGVYTSLEPGNTYYILFRLQDTFIVDDTEEQNNSKKLIKTVKGHTLAKGWNLIDEATAQKLLENSDDMQYLNIIMLDE